jgi:hypothetical protein
MSDRQQLATKATDEPLPWQPDDGKKKKYHHLEYDDSTIEGLMHYFKFQTYTELRWFLRCIRKTRCYGSATPS